jgi:choline dehydrogenase
MNTWDYIIVGGGTAGCVLAARLSEDAAVRVLLFEAGGEDNSPLLAVPGGMAFVRDWTRHAWMYHTQADASLGGRSESWRRGRGLGGSSRLNGLLWARGLPSDYDRWVAAGATGWGWDAVKPYFEKAESVTAALPERGRSGPVAVEMIRSPHELAAPLLASAAALQIPIAPDVNRLAEAGLGLAQTNQQRGVRQSTARAYLKPVRRRPNLTVLTGAEVMGLTFDGGRAAGVDYVHRGERCHAAANREIILCAGAFQSPALLMHAGIGPAEQLRKAGIAVRVDLPGVGAGLHEHPELYVEYAVNVPTYSQQMGFAQMLRSGLAFLLARSGPATSPASHILGYLKTQAMLPYPDILLFAGPWGQLSADTAFAGKRAIFSISPALCQPRSRGRLTLQSTDPRQPLRIDADLLIDPADVTTLAAAVRLVDRIASTSPFADFVIERTSPDNATLNDDQALEAWIRRTVGICYHACSTCRMGSDPMAVTDPELRVIGVSGLRICDTSVFPFVPSGNTAAPVVMLAERAADRIKASAQSPA